MSFFPLPLKPRSLPDSGGTYPFSFVSCDNESSIQFENLWTPHLEDMLAGNSVRPEMVTRDVKIAIVGAGPAGLVAAYELQKIEKAEIHVFESSERVGGRVFTVGASGNWDENEDKEKFWTTQKTYGEAGAMRLPLPPPYYLQKKYSQSHPDVNLDVAGFTEEEINQIVHGEFPYDFVEDRDFPHPMIRHYIKELELPLKRFNMNVAATKIKCHFNPPTLPSCLFEGFFVRNEQGQLEEEGKTLGDKFMAFLKIHCEEEDQKWLEEVGDLSKYFDQCITEVIRKELTNLDYEKWNNFLKDWNITYTKCLTEAKNASASLGFKRWPKHIVEFYGDVFRMNMDIIICSFIMDSELGNWWQESGMFCPHFGMHTIYEKPKATPPDARVEPKDGLKDRLNEQVQIHLNRKVTKITLTSDNNIVVSTEEDEEDKKSFDAVIVAVPPPLIGGPEGIVIDGFPPFPETTNLPLWNLDKNMYEFESPFWNDEQNNHHGFKIDDQNGFVTECSSMHGHLSQLRYSTEDEGNVVMNYEFELDALDASRDSDKTILDFIQEFHTPNIVDKAIINSTKQSDAVGKYRKPWMKLSGMPYKDVHTLTSFGNRYPAQGLYFAGDGWSFKPQWQEGAFYTALHAVFSLINDFSGANARDPFVYVAND